MAPLVDAFWSAYDAAAAEIGTADVAAAWDAPSALAGFSVGALVGHLLTAIERTASVLEAPPPSGAGVVIVDAATFYGPNRFCSPADLDRGLAPMLRADGAARAAAGRDAVLDAFTELRERLMPRLAGIDLARLVPVVQVRGGATPLGEYLRTRVVELVVHTDDVVASVGASDTAPIPTAALAVVTELFVELAIARAGDRNVVRAFARAERAEPDVLRAL